MLRLSQLERALTFQKAMGCGLDGKPITLGIPRDRPSKNEKTKRPKSVPSMRVNKK